MYAPRFDRHIEEPIANAIAVEPRHTTVVTEGNYLLHDRDGWEHVRPLLDECWYVDCDDTDPDRAADRPPHRARSQRRGGCRMGHTRSTSPTPA